MGPNHLSIPMRTVAGSALAALVVTLGLAGPAHAALVPNPGGAVVTTNSTSAVIAYADTPVIQRIDTFSTSLKAFLNGSLVFLQTFSAPFTDPTVQTAVAQTDAILFGDGASFGGPVLGASNTALLSSVTSIPAPSTCLSVLVTPTIVVGITGTSTTVTNTFGPGTISVGACQQDTFVINSPQLDINVNTEFDFTVARNVVTMNTYLTTQEYATFGATGAVRVPEPASAALLLVAFGGVLGHRVAGRRSSSRAPGHLGKGHLAGSRGR